MVDRYGIFLFQKIAVKVTHARVTNHLKLDNLAKNKVIQDLSLDDTIHLGQIESVLLPVYTLASLLAET